MCNNLFHFHFNTSKSSVLTAEVESLVSERAFSTSLTELSPAGFFLLLFRDSFPFLTFLFGEPTVPTSNLGHRTCVKENILLTSPTQKNIYINKNVLKLLCKLRNLLKHLDCHVKRAILMLTISILSLIRDVWYPTLLAHYPGYFRRFLVLAHLINRIS